MPIYKSPLAQARAMTMPSAEERLKKLSPEEWKNLQWNINRDINMGTEDDSDYETFPYQSIDDYQKSSDFDTIGGYDGIESYLDDPSWYKEVRFK